MRTPSHGGQRASDHIHFGSRHDGDGSTRGASPCAARPAPSLATAVIAADVLLLDPGTRRAEQRVDAALFEDDSMRYPGTPLKTAMIAAVGFLLGTPVALAGYDGPSNVSMQQC